jgi:hypothetical protein
LSSCFESDGDRCALQCASTRSERFLPQGELDLNRLQKLFHYRQILAQEAWASAALSEGKNDGWMRLSRMAREAWPWNDRLGDNLGKALI